MKRESWAAAAEAYCESARGAVSDSTLRVRAQRVRRMGDDLGGEPWAVTPAQLAGWLETLPGSSATVKEYRTAARAFYRWAVGAGRMRANPVPDALNGEVLPAKWRDALTLFRGDQRAVGIAEGTIQLRCKHVARFARESGCEPWGVVYEQIASWLSSTGTAEPTRNIMRGAIRAFYRWAVRTGRAVDDPTDVLARSVLERPTPELWREPLRAWRAHELTAGRSAETLRTRGEQLRRFARDHGSMSPWAVTINDMLEWSAAKRWGRETRRSMRSTLRSFYGWAEKVGRIDASPANLLPIVKGAQPSPRPAQDDDYARALAFADPRERLALRLAAELGLRRGEVARVHSRDMRRDDEGWNLRVIGKGARTRVLPLTEDLSRALRTREAGYVFPGRVDGHISAQYLGKRLSAILPPGVTMHMLRHRFATGAYNLDRDVFAVQELLGHASPATTRRYVQVSSTTKRRLVETFAHNQVIQMRRQ